MTPFLGSLSFYFLVPAVAFALGGSIAIFRPPETKVNSAVQHLAAGLIFAAVAVELLPEEKGRRPLAVIIGFGLGTVVMLLLEWLIEKTGRSEHDAGLGGMSMAIFVAVDIVIDGVLIGLAFTLGSKQGLLITSAMSIEFLSLGMTTLASLQETGMSRKEQLGTAFGLAILPLIGVVAGVAGLRGMADIGISLLIAFAIAALLYLVTEELLTEAHKYGDTRFGAAMFFAGFLLMFVIDMAT